MESILVRTHRPSYRGYSKARVISRLPELFTEQELDRLISDALFERDYTLIGVEIERFRREYGKKRSRKTGQRKQARRTKQ